MHVHGVIVPLMHVTLQPACQVLGNRAGRRRHKRSRSSAAWSPCRRCSEVQTLPAQPTHLLRGCSRYAARHMPAMSSSGPLRSLQGCSYLASQSHYRASCFISHFSRPYTRAIVSTNYQNRLRHWSPRGAEYEAGSEVFVQKIRSLESTYGAIRRARGDGNCFFRSFIFALFEHILQHRDYDERYRCAPADCYSRLL